MKKYLLLFGITFFVVTVRSQSLPDSIVVIDDSYIDFSVPDIGAFTLLNTKPTTISNPGNTKEFAASLLNVVGSGRAITPGLAIDWAPYRIIRDSTFIKTPESYRKDFFLRSIQLTMGTIGDSSGTNIATGIKWTVWDKSDPLNDSAFGANLLKRNSRTLQSNAQDRQVALTKKDLYLDAVLKARGLDSLFFSLAEKLDTFFAVSRKDSLFYKQEILVIKKMIADSINGFFKQLNLSRDAAHKIAMLSPEEKEELESICHDFKMAALGDIRLAGNLSEDVRKMKKQWMKQHWNSAVVTIGVGWVGNSVDNKWATLKTQSFKGYINGKCRLGPKSQLTYIGMYGVPTAEAKTDSSIKSQTFTGVRFLYGNAKNRASLDLGYGYDLAKNSAYHQQTLLVTVGFEFKVSDGVFFEIATGFFGDPQELQGANILAIGNLKYAFHRKSRFDLPE